MTRQSPPELFAQRPIRSDFGRYQQRSPRLNFRRVFVLLGLLALAVGGGFLISSLGSNGDSAPETLPHIAAEGPIKEKPENPGGIDIPHQDVQVFSELDGKTAAGQAAAQNKVEHLLPAPDTPQPVAMESAKPPVDSKPTEVLASVEPTQAPQTVQPPPVAEITPDPAPQPVQNVAKPIEPAAPVKEPAKPTPKKVEVKKADKVEETMARLPKELFTAETPTAPKEEAPAAVKTETAPAPASGKKARLQLASLPDQANAEKTAEKLRSQYAADLGGAGLTVVKAEIAGKGTYYRVMSAPLPESQAKEICAALTRKKAACLIAR